MLIYINGPPGILGIQPSTSQFNLQLKMAESFGGCYVQHNSYVTIFIAVIS